MSRRRNIPTWYCERGPLPGSWYADPKGVNGGSSLVGTTHPPLANALKTPLPPGRRRAVLAALEALTASGSSAWDQPPLKSPLAWRSELGIASDRQILFFPLQVDVDTNMRFFSPHFASSLDALRAVAEQAGPEWFLLVKPHPKGTYPAGGIEHVLGDRTRGRCVSRINLHDAIGLAELTVTINSTAGIEAAWRNKPVLQLGRGILTGHHIACELDPSRPLNAQLHEAVDVWRHEPDRYERALRLFDYLQREYLLSADSLDDANRLLDRLRPASLRPAQPPHRPTDLTELVASFTWKPAVQLFEKIAAEHAEARTIHLLGLGQNARRLLRAVPQHPAARGWRWAGWDDREEPRNEAVRLGLPLHDPWSRRVSSPGSLLIVTPRDSAPLAARLQAAGYVAGRDFLHLIPPTGPKSACDTRTAMQNST